MNPQWDSTVYLLSLNVKNSLIAVMSDSVSGGNIYSELDWCDKIG